MMLVIIFEQSFLFYIKYGFTSILDSGEEMGQCVLCSEFKFSFYLALLVMITFIQVDTSSYRACKKLQYPSTFRTALQLFFIRTNNKRKLE